MHPDDGNGNRCTTACTQRQQKTTERGKEAGGGGGPNQNNKGTAAEEDLRFDVASSLSCVFSGSERDKEMKRKRDGGNTEIARAGAAARDPNDTGTGRELELKRLASSHLHLIINCGMDTVL